HDMVGEINEGAEPHLSEMVDDLDLTPEELLTVEPALITYEQGLLKRMRSTRLVLREGADIILDAVDRFGFRTMGPMEIAAFMEDEENQEEFKTLFDVASKPIQATAHDIATFNRRSLSQVMTALPDAQAKTLQDRYFRNVYYEAYAEVPEWRPRYLLALKQADLDSDQKTAVRASLQSFSTRDVSLLNDIGDALDDYRKYRTFTQLEFEEEDEFAGKLDTKVSRRIALANAAISGLDSMLTPAQLAALDAGDSEPQQLAEVMPTVVATTTGDGVQVEMTIESESVDSWSSTPEAAMLPGPFSRREVQSLCDQMDMSDDDRLIIDMLYRDYASAYDAAIKSVNSDEEPDEDQSAAMVIRAIAERRTQASQRLVTTDQSLFANLAPFVTDDKRESFDAVRRLREREYLNTQSKLQSASWGFFGIDEEAFIDLETLPAIKDLNDTDRATLRPIFEDYGNQRLAFLRQQVEAAAAQRIAFEIFQAASVEENFQGDISERLQKRWRTKREELQRVARASAGLNQQYFAEIREALSPDVAWSIEFAYNEIAFPDLYREASEINSRVTRVLRFEDLLPHQRQSIMQASSEFRDQFERMTRALVDMRRERSSEQVFFEMPSREFIEREISMERLQFDRREVAERTRERIRLLLTDDQRARLSGDDEGDETS
ncbi:MAG: hypothetical protein AAF432_16100, partial [Planctomycetota bacterium]